jgi:uncharacterized protein YceK
MTTKILIILALTVLLGGCASTKGCKRYKFESDRRECEEADMRFYNQTGWRYERFTIR